MEREREREREREGELEKGDRQRNKTKRRCPLIFRGTSLERDCRSAVFRSAVFRSVIFREPFGGFTINDVIVFFNLILIFMICVREPELSS